MVNVKMTKKRRLHKEVMGKYNLLLNVNFEVFENLSKMAKNEIEKTFRKLDRAKVYTRVTEKELDEINIELDTCIKFIENYIHGDILDNFQGFKEGLRDRGIDYIDEMMTLEEAEELTPKDIMIIEIEINRIVNILKGDTEHKFKLLEMIRKTELSKAYKNNGVMAYKCIGLLISRCEDNIEELTGFEVCL